MAESDSWNVALEQDPSKKHTIHLPATGVQVVLAYLMLAHGSQKSICAASSPTLRPHLLRRRAWPQQLDLEPFQTDIPDRNTWHRWQRTICRLRTAIRDNPSHMLQQRRARLHLLHHLRRVYLEAARPSLCASEAASDIPGLDFHRLRRGDRQPGVQHARRPAMGVLWR